MPFELAFADFPAKDLEFFEVKIRPLLVKRCYECHSEKEQEAGLRLDSRANVLRGGAAGPAMVPGDLKKSLLVEAVQYDNPDFQMPPDGKLPAAEIALLEQWVKLGAPWPAEVKPKTTATKAFEITDEHRAFWSFQPVRKPALPMLEQSNRGVSRIDQFILAKLAETNLQHSPTADRYTLLRRLHFDLTGLPPSPDEIFAFVHDEAPDAWERAIDRLLSSPRFGERWGRHWLDLVRYCETAGHVQDKERPYTWRYRDYVIDALNDDLPYDQFVREHIAGDLLPPRLDATGNFNQAAIATNFLWFHEMHFRPVDPIQQRADQVDAQIDVIGKTFLGLTIACARCHDHKFAPISQRDYYALAGFLFSTQSRLTSVATTEPEKEKQSNAKRQQIAKIVSAAMKSAKQQQSQKTTEPIPLTEDNFAPNQRDQLAKLRRELERLQPDMVFGRVAHDVDGHDSRLHIRGSHKTLGDPVSRRFIEILANPHDNEPFGNRSGREFLARAIADRNNPLTTRVIVNRLWQHLFGEGLVRTPSNFGLNGQPPTHPKLLDYLAARLVENDWSLKAVLREILISQTYRMSSQPDPSAMLADATNQTWHHRPMRRLEAEAIRDSVLAASERLDSAMSGYSIPPFVPPYTISNKPVHIPKSGPVDGAGRRSVYIKVRRNFFTPFLKTFDFPDPGSSVGQRDVTIVSSQSLAMLNSKFIHEQAINWAHQIEQHRDARQNIKAMFVRAIGRPPRSSELESLMPLVSPKPTLDDWSDVAHVLFNMNEFIFLH